LRLSLCGSGMSCLHQAAIIGKAALSLPAHESSLDFCPARYAAASGGAVEAFQGLLRFQPVSAPALPAAVKALAAAAVPGGAGSALQAARCPCRRA